tara:strand:- start:336 stop:440 length:105 start_codon:yes stop_codon:yes gene_type:complete
MIATIAMIIIMSTLIMTEPDPIYLEIRIKEGGKQ